MAASGTGVISAHIVGGPDADWAAEISIGGRDPESMETALRKIACGVRPARNGKNMCSVQTMSAMELRSIARRALLREREPVRLDWSAPTRVLS